MCDECEDYELFEKNKFLDQFICSIGRGIITNPYSVNCPNSHIFCKKCITTWMKEENKCPLCKEHISKTFNITILKETVINTFIRTCNDCKQKYTQDDYLNHKCSHEIIKCNNIKNGCQYTCLRKDYNNHINKCEYYLEQCKKCKETVVMKTHLCPNEEINCEHCQLKILRLYYDNHIDVDCPNYIIDCQYGCDLKLKRSEMMQHYIDNYVMHITKRMDNNILKTLSDFKTIPINKNIPFVMEKNKEIYIYDYLKNICKLSLEISDTAVLLVILPIVLNTNCNITIKTYKTFEDESDDYFNHKISSNKKIKQKLDTNDSGKYYIKIRINKNN